MCQTELESFLRNIKDDMLRAATRQVDSSANTRSTLFKICMCVCLCTDCGLNLSPCLWNSLFWAHSELRKSDQGERKKKYRGGGGGGGCELEFLLYSIGSVSSYALRFCFSVLMCLCVVLTKKVRGKNCNFSFVSGI